MIRLRIGYLITGIITGLLLLLSFFTTIPDGKLHVIICNVGQGDGIYIRLPDGKDMLIDGGPGNKIISCLSRHMPFWDRTIDMAILTHPQNDHLKGLLSVMERFQVTYLVRSDVENTTEGFTALKQLVAQKHSTEKFATSRETITVGPVRISLVWPTREQIALMKPINNITMQQCNNSLKTPCPSVLGATSDANINDGSVVFSLSYGTFDALFTGDADSHIQPQLLSSQRPGLLDPIAGKDGVLELLKVPHHGSKTGMTNIFIEKIAPSNTVKAACSSNNITMKQFINFSCPLAVISVGQNSYGHPAPEIIQKLESAGFQVKRTDKDGDIEIVSDGKEWDVKNGR